MAAVTEVTHHVQYAVGGRRTHLADHTTVSEKHDAVGVRSGEWIVGDHDDRLPQFRDRVPEKFEQVSARAGVKVAGRLVGEDDLRLACKCACGGDTLLLPTRELVGAVLETVTEAGNTHHLGERGRIGFPSGDGERQHDVVECRERRDQVE